MRRQIIFGLDGEPPHVHIVASCFGEPRLVLSPEPGFPDDQTALAWLEACFRKMLKGEP